MVEHTTFLGACRDHAGDGLRAVIGYDDEGYETLYRREDVATLSGTRLSALVAAARDVHSPLRLLPDEGGAVGGYRASAHAFGDAVVLQFVVGQRRGYLACIDRDANAERVEVLERLDEAARQ